MKLSIITVTYNNSQGLERTIKSIEKQTCKDFEYIIVDGSSNDNSLEIIKKYEKCISKWISEPDNGIYNAMNKGVKIANGDYCLFMNSGDELYSENTVENIYSCDFTEDFVQGITYQVRNGIETMYNPPKDITLAFYFYGNNNYHQSSLIKREMLLRHPYDEKLRIASDYKFNIECIIIYNCSYKPIDVIISNYEYGGRSVSVKHKDEIRKIYEELIPNRIKADYLDNICCYKKPGKYIMPILRWFAKHLLNRYQISVKD